MAYAGTTSTSPVLPVVVSQGITGRKTWQYDSTHVSSDIEEIDFFTDGDDLGMKPGDLLTAMQFSSLPFSSTAVSTGDITSHYVVIVGSSTTRVSTGTTVGIGQAS